MALCFSPVVTVGIVPASVPVVIIVSFLLVIWLLMASSVPDVGVIPAIIIASSVVIIVAIPGV